MNYINKYTRFLESKKSINILEFLSEIGFNDPYRGDDYMIKWTNKFIGDGWFEKIKKHVELCWSELNKVDLEYIDDRLYYDIWDKYPNKGKQIYHQIVGKSYYDIGYGIDYELKIKNESDINIAIRSIIYQIINETTNATNYDGVLPSIRIRNSREELYVDDEKFNCINFDIRDYNTKDIPQHILNRYKLYSPENILNQYKGSICIEMKEVEMCEELLDDFYDSIKSILPAINYDEISDNGYDRFNITLLNSY